MDLGGRVTHGAVTEEIKSSTSSFCLINDSWFGAGTKDIQECICRASLKITNMLLANLLIKTVMLLVVLKPPNPSFFEGSHTYVNAT